MQTLRNAFSTFAPTYGNRNQNVGLEVRLVEEFALQFRMLTVVAFLPPQDVVRGFAAVSI